MWKWKSLSHVQLFVTPGILQARILEWVAFPFSRGSSQPRDRNQVSCIAGGFFTSWATREAWTRGISHEWEELFKGDSRVCITRRMVISVNQRGRLRHGISLVKKRNDSLGAVLSINCVTGHDCRYRFVSDQF